MWEEISASKEGEHANLLMHLRRHQLKQYAELIEAHGKC